MYYTYFYTKLTKFKKFSFPLGLRSQYSDFSAPIADPIIYFIRSLWIYMSICLFSIFILFYILFISYMIFMHYACKPCSLLSDFSPPNAECPGSDIKPDTFYRYRREGVWCHTTLSPRLAFQFTESLRVMSSFFCFAADVLRRFKRSALCVLRL